MTKSAVGNFSVPVNECFSFFSFPLVNCVCVWCWLGGMYFFFFFVFGCETGVVELGWLLVRVSVLLVELLCCPSWTLKHLNNQTLRKSKILTEAGPKERIFPRIAWVKKDQWISFHLEDDRSNLPAQYYIKVWIGNVAQLLFFKSISFTMFADDEKRLVEEVFNNAVDCLSDEDKKLPQVRRAFQTPTLISFCARQRCKLLQ